MCLCFDGNVFPFGTQTPASITIPTKNLLKLNLSTNEMTRAIKTHTISVLKLIGYKHKFSKQILIGKYNPVT